jgi:hypothetical protein
VAILINQTSNLRLRLELVRRLSDGVERPASLEFSAVVERYKQLASAERGEHRFVPLVALAGKPMLDMDLITFLQELEAMLGGAAGAPGVDPSGPPPHATFEATVEPSLGLRVAGGPESFLVEVGIDLVALLEPVAGVKSDPGADLALFRFLASGRAVASFCQQLIDEFQRFPTDPSKVSAGPRQ